MKNCEWEWVLRLPSHQSFFPLIFSCSRVVLIISLIKPVFNQAYYIGNTSDSYSSEGLNRCSPGLFWSKPVPLQTHSHTQSVIRGDFVSDHFYMDKPTQLIKKDIRTVCKPHDHYLKGQTHTSHSLYCILIPLLRSFVCLLLLIWVANCAEKWPSPKVDLVLVSSWLVWHQQLLIFHTEDVLMWLYVFSVTVLCLSRSVALSSASQTVSPEISWDDRRISGCTIISVTSTETNPLWPSRRWEKLHISCSWTLFLTQESGVH